MAQLSFEPMSFNVMEGDTFEVCLRLGWSGWFQLEVDVTVILQSEGSEFLISSLRRSKDTFFMFNIQ